MDNQECCISGCRNPQAYDSACEFHLEIVDLIKRIKEIEAENEALRSVLACGDAKIRELEMRYSGIKETLRITLEMNKNLEEQKAKSIDYLNGIFDAASTDPYELEAIKYITEITK